MLSKTRDTPAGSSAPGVIPDPIAGPVGSGAPVRDGAPVSNGAPVAVAREPDMAPAGSTAQTSGPETRAARFRRNAHRTRLYAYAVGAVALIAFLIALATSNTARVKVSWVFGTSHVSLVWLVLFAAILGWLLGLLATAAFHWRTRAPRRTRASRRRSGATS
jgi:uncharacterized integral membrane protein